MIQGMKFDIKHFPHGLELSQMFQDVTSCTSLRFLQISKIGKASFTLPDLQMY